jgi:hypothetical protein
MKGVVFNLLEQAVTEAHGEDVWADLLDDAGFDGAYTSLGSYPDAQMFAIVDVASSRFQLPTSAILRWFGRSAMPMLAERYRPFFQGHASARGFILSVNDIIHPEVRKLYSGAGCPHFHFTSNPDGRLMIGYQSERRLCHLAHGFVEGAADHYGEAVDLEHVSCMHAGDPVCRMAVRWIQ